MTTFPLTTTLNRIHACNPCQDEWEKGLAAAGKTTPDDEPITYERILNTVGLEDALWTCRAEPQHARLWRLYAIWCARRVQHLMTDARSLAALDVAERHANGQATDADLEAAWDAARDAAIDATWGPVKGAAGDAAIAATWDAAWDGASAAAWDAAWAASWDATWTAERQAQTDAFRQLVTTGTLP